MFRGNNLVETCLCSDVAWVIQRSLQGHQFLSVPMQLREKPCISSGEAQ